MITCDRLSDRIARANARRAAWPDPSPEMRETSTFLAIWNVIKTWDINVPGQYVGYCGATGNHVVAIMNALPGVPE